MTARRGAGPVMLVLGTRPEAIKMLPVLRELRARRLPTLLVVTGQHRSMIDQVFRFHEEAPDIDLDLMRPNHSLNYIASSAITALETVYLERRPSLVMVHGDTTTAMAAALSAFHARVPVAHVEAGLRSFDVSQPWPEEFNRVCIDSLADLLFAPTEGAALNLSREYARGTVIVTGNTGIDALLYMSDWLERNDGLHFDASSLPALDPSKRLILVTGHRRENFGPGFEQICEGLLSLASRGDVEIVYPVHLNPNVRAVVSQKLSSQPGVHLIEPVTYDQMVYLMKKACILITDSGGIQEEGPALGKPVLVMRDVTERPEAVELGGVRLVGTDPTAIKREADLLLDHPEELARRSQPMFPYGDGQASKRIVDAIVRWADHGN